MAKPWVVACASTSSRSSRRFATPSDIRGDTVMTMHTYVNFAGSCTEAFRYYEQHLGAKIEMLMTHAQSPQPTPVPPEWKKAVLHARLAVAGTVLMGADIPTAEPMRSAYLSLSVASDTEAERVYEALSNAGTVFMPLQ